MSCIIRIVCLLAWPVLVGLQANAQLKIIYNESFVSNAARWPVENSAAYSSNVVHGHYELIMHEHSQRWVYVWPNINPHKYFIIEMRFKADSTTTSFAPGIVWNVGTGTKNLFRWFKSGHVEAQVTSAEGTTVAASGTSDIKMVNGEYYTMKVKSFSNHCEFYINDKSVLKTEKKLPFTFQSGVGAFINENGALKIDHLRVYQEKEEINLAQTDFKMSNKTNLGSAVNTVHEEIMPVISHDGKTLYFIRRGHPKNTGSSEMDDIWVSTCDDNGKFTTATNLGKPVNNSTHNGVAGFSADGKKMVVLGKYSKDGNYLGPGYCEFTLTNEGWANPRNLDINNFYNLNSYQEASYSPDGNVMLFTIERRDSYGGKDVYISLKQADGTWSTPFNAGKEINSFANENSPFLAGDNKTLYFASEGLSGYGSSDIFMTRRLDDTWKNWSKPINMGPEINTTDWDAYFTIDSKGQWAYMVSNHHSVGKADVFMFRVPKELRPDSLAAEKVLALIENKDTSVFSKHETQYDSSSIITNVTTVNTDTVHENKLELQQHLRLFGKIYDAETGAQIPAVTVIKEVEKNVEVLRQQHDAAGFSVVVEQGYNYAISAEYNGYIAEQVNVDLTNSSGQTEREVKILLKRIKVEQTITLNNIFFEESSTTVRFDSRGELVHVADLMQKHPTMKILIGGHTSKNQADAKFNKKISTERAKAVYDELIKLGVSKKRLKYKGFGYDKPAYDVNSLWENAKNRRVDFTIIEL